MRCLLLHIYILCILPLSLLSCASQRGVEGLHGGSPLIVAHRGGAALGPENSLLAVERSIALGVDAVEVDVRMSADGCPVVMHDKSVDRTTDGEGRVSELGVNEIKGLCLKGVDEALSGERVPTLEELLLCVAGRCTVLIEVKDDDGRGLERAVMDVVERCSAGGWVAVQSFSDAVLERFHEAGASFPLEKLFVFKVPFLPYIFDGTFRRLSMEKYDYVSSFNIRKSFARKGLVRRLRAQGKEVKVWTLGENDKELPYSVDGVITDFPHYFLP